jgi:hypothetical protein
LPPQAAGALSGGTSGNRPSGNQTEELPPIKILCLALLGTPPIRAAGQARTDHLEKRYVDAAEIVQPTSAGPVPIPGFE